MKRSGEAPSLLVVDDDPAIGETLRMVLGDAGYGIDVCEDGQQGVETALAGEYDVVLTDFRMPGMGGLELLATLTGEDPGRPVVFMTAHGNTELAIEATKKGAFDYLLKPFDIDQLLDTVNRAVSASRRGRGRIPVRRSVAPDQPRLLGNSRAMQEVSKAIGHVAPPRASVLVVGETGTGKELISRSLHEHSLRSEGLFVAVNCGAIPENLLESELFGHVKGAFTGASSDRPGRFTQARGGTLFLDEIGDMPTSVQVKLLRVLQEGVYHPLGGSREETADVRIVAATHRDLPAMIRDGHFREDLYFRLSAIRIEVPPLRERNEDIPDLIAAFVSAAATEYQVPEVGISRALVRHLQEQPWPGNIRQLQNVVRHLVLHARGMAATREMVDDALEGASTVAPVEEHDPVDLVSWVERALDQACEGEGGAHSVLVRELETMLIRAALKRSGGHLGKVTEWLGISRVTLRKKMADYRIGGGDRG